MICRFSKAHFNMPDEHAAVEYDGLIRLGEGGYCGEDG